MKLVIIGGVAGGATAAARARRLDEHAQIILFERGEYISFANCGLPYFVGDIIKERRDLLITTVRSFSQRYRIDVRVMHEITAIDPVRKVVHVKNVLTGESLEESYDKLILSPGASPIEPPLEGIDHKNVFTLRTIPDAERIKAAVAESRGGSAVVIGGGFIGLEMVENLVHAGIKVAVLEKLDQVLPPFDPEMAAIVQAKLAEKGVVCELGNGLTGIHERGERLVVTTEKGVELSCDFVILSVGVRPENKLAREAGLSLTERGHIVVDEHMQTSDPHIYATGDAVSVKDFVSGLPTVTALAGPANKQARIAADNAMGREALFTGTLGTAVVKVFEMSAACTGVSEKVLTQRGVPFRASYTHSGSHAYYYPGAQVMSIKLLFAPDDGKILGAQIVGGDGVDKRIDVIATAMHGGMRAADLEELELAYAPPYSSAKDPVNIAGYVAGNILNGDMAPVSWRELDALGDDMVLIDLREDAEIQANGSMPQSLHIPLPRLRERMAELDRSKTYVLYCAVGLRSYIAQRILVQNGFTARSLSGGFETFSSAKR